MDQPFVELQSNDAIHLFLLGGGLSVVGITVQAPLVLAAVQAPPHRRWRTCEMIVPCHLLDP